MFSVYLMINSCVHHYWGSQVRALLSVFLSLFVCQAAGYERCYLEPTSKNVSSCYLALWNSKYACEALTPEGDVSCRTKSDEPVDCIVKEVTMRGPKEIWCNGPPLVQDENAQITFMPMLSQRKRLVAEGAEEGANLPSRLRSTSNENCDAYLTVGQDSWDFNRQYGLKVRCLKRKAVVEGVIPKENCDALLTEAPGTFGAYFDENRRQACLDRQAGIASQPNRTRVCTTFGQTTICR